MHDHAYLLPNTLYQLMYLFPSSFRFHFLPQIVVMPISGTPDPSNKRKKPSKIITDFSNISQHGQCCFFVSQIDICSRNTHTILILVEHSLAILCDDGTSVVNVTLNYQSPHWCPVSTRRAKARNAKQPPGSL